MTTKYAVFKTNEGIYEYYDTDVLAVSSFLTEAVNNYLKTISGYPISIVEIDNDGNEKWYGDELKTKIISNGNIELEKSKDESYRRNLILTQGLLNMLNSANTDNSLPIITFGE